MENIIKSKAFKITVLVVAACIVALVIFCAGMFVGIRKAEFTGHWYEGYRANFLPAEAPGYGMMRRGALVSSQQMMGGHAVVGSVLSMTSSTLIIKATDGTEKTVLMDTNTAIRKLRSEIKPTDLRANDRVTVIGTPDQNGDIDASLIRIVDQNF